MREQVYTRWREGAVSQGLHEGAGLHKVEGGREGAVSQGLHEGAGLHKVEGPSSKSRFTRGSRFTQGGGREGAVNQGLQGFAESLQQNLEDPRPKTLPYLEE